MTQHLVRGRSVGDPSLIEDPLSEKLLWKEFRVGETIIVDVENDEIIFRSVEGLTPPPVELAEAGADS